ncbi:MAG: HAD family phosphatase [Acidimicrobiales bacterium]|nr:HAD family phosphatase [Acidimicrobiales bacterium]
MIVVFDLGNVLIPWDRRFLYEKLIPDPTELDHFLDHVLTLDVNARLDRGTTLPALVAPLIDQHPQHQSLLEAFRDRWVETVKEPYPETVALLRELVDAGRTCYALSNWGADTFAMVQHQYRFLDWFDGLVISGREGVVKPEPEIFHRMCARYDFRPADALFIDDSAANIAAADRLGFATHLFTEPALLRADLTARGLL